MESLMRYHAKVQRNTFFYATCTVYNCMNTIMYYTMSHMYYSETYRCHSWKLNSCAKAVLYIWNTPVLCWITSSTNKHVHVKNSTHVLYTYMPFS